MSYAVTSPDVLVKQPSEIRHYTMDFSNLLGTGETLSSIASSAIELRGGGTSDISLTDVEINAAATGVTFWASGGTDNTTHRITIIVVTSESQTIEGDGILAVKDS